MSAEALAGRVALVAGGGRSAGRAIAEALHAAGASLVIADNGTSPNGSGADPSIATSLAASLGGRAVAYCESIASPSSAAAAVDLAKRRFGGLDILVHAAAIRRPRPLKAADALAWDAVLRTNLSAAAHLLAASMPHLRQGGRFIAIVPAEALSGAAGETAEASAAAGLLALTRGAAAELASRGVTANAILRLPDATAEAVAALALWLAGAAGDGATGQVFGVRRREILLFPPPRPAIRVRGAPGPLLAEALAAAGLRPDPDLLPPRD